MVWMPPNGSSLCPRPLAYTMVRDLPGSVFSTDKPEPSSPWATIPAALGGAGSRRSRWTGKIHATTHYAGEWAAIAASVRYPSSATWHKGR
jgi:hypothetical protein